MITIIKSYREGRGTRLSLFERAHYDKLLQRETEETTRWCLEAGCRIMEGRNTSSAGTVFLTQLQVKACTETDLLEGRGHDTGRACGLHQVSRGCHPASLHVDLVACMWRGCAPDPSLRATRSPDPRSCSTVAKMCCTIVSSACIDMPSDPTTHAAKLASGRIKARPASQQAERASLP
jgi:hypothetical protein